MSPEIYHLDESKLAKNEVITVNIDVAIVDIAGVHRRNVTFDGSRRKLEGKLRLIFRRSKVAGKELEEHFPCEN